MEVTGKNIETCSSGTLASDASTCDEFPEKKFAGDTKLSSSDFKDLWEDAKELAKCFNRVGLQFWSVALEKHRGDVTERGPNTKIHATGTTASIHWLSRNPSILRAYQDHLLGAMGNTHPEETATESTLDSSENAFPQGSAQVAPQRQAIRAPIPDEFPMCDDIARANIQPPVPVAVVPAPEGINGLTSLQKLMAVLPDHTTCPNLRTILLNPVPQVRNPGVEPGTSVALGSRLLATSPSQAPQTADSRTPTTDSQEGITAISHELQIADSQALTSESQESTAAGSQAVVAGDLQQLLPADIKHRQCGQIQVVDRLSLPSSRTNTAAPPILRGARYERNQLCAGVGGSPSIFPSQSPSPCPKPISLREPTDPAWQTLMPKVSVIAMPSVGQSVVNVGCAPTPAEGTAGGLNKRAPRKQVLVYERDVDDEGARILAQAAGWGCSSEDDSDLEDGTDDEDDAEEWKEEPGNEEEEADEVEEGTKRLPNSAKRGPLLTKAMRRLKEDSDSEWLPPQKKRKSQSEKRDSDEASCSEETDITDSLSESESNSEMSDDFEDNAAGEHGAKKKKVPTATLR